MSWNGGRIERGEAEAFRMGVSLSLDVGNESTWFDTGTPVDVEFIRLPPGGRNWPHRLKRSRWGVYSIEQGTGRVSTPMGWVEVRAGDWILQPPGRQHHLINTGERELWLLIILRRAGLSNYAFP